MKFLSIPFLQGLNGHLKGCSFELSLGDTKISSISDISAVVSDKKNVHVHLPGKSEHIGTISYLLDGSLQLCKESFKASIWLNGIRVPLGKTFELQEGI
jgi:hypothetical protein